MMTCAMLLVSCKKDTTTTSCDFDNVGGTYMNPSDQSAIIVLGTYAGENDTINTVSSSGSALFKNTSSGLQNGQVESLNITINEGIFSWSWLFGAYIFTYTAHDIGNQPVTYNIVGAGDLASATVTNGVWPGYPIITSGNSVTKSSGHTVTLASEVANAERILVEFKAPDASGSEVVVAAKMFEGNATSLAFSASDLKCIPSGATYGGIAVHALHRFSTTVAGKTYYFWHYRRMLQHITIQ